MSPPRILLASAALASLAGLAQAQTAVPVAHFDSVELEGGGHVVIRHGDAQRVVLVKGSTRFTTFETGSNSHKLTIKTCNRDCPEQYDLEIEITTPDIAAVAIEGGGHIESDGAFPGQHAITAAVRGRRPYRSAFDQRGRCDGSRRRRRPHRAARRGASHGGGEWRRPHRLHRQRAGSPRPSTAADR